MKQMIESILFINNAKRDYSQIIDYSNHTLNKRTKNLHDRYDKNDYNRQLI